MTTAPPEDPLATLVATLAQRVDRLEDVERARGLLATYADVMDAEPRPDDVAALFLADAELTTPAARARGTAEISAFYAGALERDPAAKRHFITNVRPTWLSPGRVRLRSYFLFTGRRPDSSRIGWGRYDDLVDTTGPEPRFASKEMAIDVGTDLAHGWASGGDLS